MRKTLLRAPVFAGALIVVGLGTTLVLRLEVGRLNLTAGSSCSTPTRWWLSLGMDLSDIVA